jgi:hypothetical protein
MKELGLFAEMQSMGLAQGGQAKPKRNAGQFPLMDTECWLNQASLRGESPIPLSQDYRRHREAVQVVLIWKSGYLVLESPLRDMAGV